MIKAQQRVSALRGPSVPSFWLSTGRLRSNFVVVRLGQTEDRAQQPRDTGNVGFSLFALAAGAARWVGWVTPFGGVALIVGWAALATIAVRRG